MKERERKKKLRKGGSLREGRREVGFSVPSQPPKRRIQNFISCRSESLEFLLDGELDSVGSEAGGGGAVQQARRERNEMKRNERASKVSFCRVRVREKEDELGR